MTRGLFQHSGAKDVSEFAIIALQKTGSKLLFWLHLISSFNTKHSDPAVLCQPSAPFALCLPGRIRHYLC